MANENKKSPKFVDRSPSVTGQDYSRLLHELKENYRKAQIKAAVRVNSDLLEYYWFMGRQISSLQAKSKWGTAFFDTLSIDLKAEFPNQSGFSVTNIKYIVRWYNFYNQSDTIRQRVVDELYRTEEANLQQVVAELEMPAEFGLIPWGHHIDIFTKAKSISEALFYIEKTIEANWSRPELKEKIKEDLYRNHGKAITNFEDKLPAPYSRLADSIFKSPYNLEFIGGETGTVFASG